MDKDKIIEQITSRDTHLVWLSCCEIISHSQDPDEITPLIEYLPEIRQATAGLVMGGALAPNQRFVNMAIKIIEFYSISTDCPCNLYEDEGYNGFDPEEEHKKKNVKIINEVKRNWMINYVAKCQKCGRVFDVAQREYHYTWWKWNRKTSAKYK